MLNKRYFNYTLNTSDDSGSEKIIEIIGIEVPKLKVLRKIENMRVDPDNAIPELISMVHTVLQRNKFKKKYTEEFIEEYFDIDDMTDFLESYFNWVGEVKSDPN